ncbi:MAG: translation elongation factor-like protein [Thermoplasmata archaeon]|nr:translation elongation factor-like protein [Thermoplasmata archaeon]
MVAVTKEVLVGTVLQFFAKPSVAAIEITAEGVAVGDTLRIKGTTTDFEQTVESMEIDRQPVQNVGAGTSVGIKVKDRVRVHDKVFKLMV